MSISKISILAKEVYSKDILILNLDYPTKDATDLMLSSGKEEIIVVNSLSQLEGLITFRDLPTITSDICQKKTVLEDRLFKEAIYAAEDSTLEECRNVMVENKIGRLPIVKDKRIVGIIRASHIRDFHYTAAEEIGIQMKSILEHVYEAVCTIDSSGIVTFWNGSAERIYKVKKEDIVGKHIGDFFPTPLLLEVLETKKPFENVHHTPRENTEIIISAAPLYFRGKLVGAVSSERDITTISKPNNELKRANHRVKYLESVIEPQAGIVGISPVFKATVKLGLQAAPSKASVLLSGESGTGKEVLARLIHENSGRTGLFVPVNCSAIPRELFESEFFGYAAGAFTGASNQGKAGFFELAHGGSLFLDEIADLPLHMQAKLLRVLEDQKLSRLGSTKSINIDVRIISASHKNLRKMTDEREFRDDLFYRLNVIHIKIPPLRDRKIDIPLFIKAFTDEIAKKNSKPKITYDEDAIKALENHSWKGNIRELRNSIERMVVLCEKDTISLADLPAHILKSSVVADKSESIMSLSDATKKLEKHMINEALKNANFNKTKAATLLGIKRTTLLYKMKVYEIDF